MRGDPPAAPPLIVDGAALHAAVAGRSLQVAAIADLVRIAESEAQLIFHQQLQGACAYFVPMANGTTAELVLIDR